MSYQVSRTFPDKWPSELEGDDLVKNRLEMIERDIDYRERHVDFERAADLFERDTGEREDNLPEVNFVRRAVEDYIAIAIQNVPEARLDATKQLESIQNPFEREFRARIFEETEETINAFIKTVLQENDYNDEVGRAIRQSAIYGIGYLLTNVNRSADVRNDFRLRQLIYEKPLTEWTEKDAKLYNRLTKRLNVEHIDSRDVYWQYGQRRLDDETRRVSIIERADTEYLRQYYNNENIMPGRFPSYINEDPNFQGDIDEEDITAVITTWEYEPEHVTKTASYLDAEYSAYGRGGQMVMTKIAGGELIRKEVNNPVEGQINLPIIPFYLRESEEHPYGFSLPLMLEISQEFINLMRAIIYKSAKNSVSPQGVLVNISNLAPDDVKKVNRVLSEGGAADIELGTSRSVQDTIMPLSYNQSQLSGAAVEAMSNEERVFQVQSQSLDESAIARAESGQAKRAQIMADDRPKTISISLLSESVENVWENLHELTQVHYRDEVKVEVDNQDQGRRQVPLNRQGRATVPMARGDQMFLRESNVTDENPGFVPEQVDFTRNDVTLPMKAKAEGRSSLPVDKQARMQMLMTPLELGVITPETFRELVLDEEIKAIDDRNRQRQDQVDQMVQQAQNQTRNIQNPGNAQENARQQIAQDSLTNQRTQELDG